MFYSWMLWVCFPPGFQLCGSVSHWRAGSKDLRTISPRLKTEENCISRGLKQTKKPYGFILIAIWLWGYDLPEISIWFLVSFSLKVRIGAYKMTRLAIGGAHLCISGLEMPGGLRENETWSPHLDWAGGALRRSATVELWGFKERMLGTALAM